MPTTPTNFVLIEKYFNGEIDEDERELFLKKYLEDVDFRSDVDSYKLFSHVFKNMSPDNENRIKNYLENESENSKPIRFLGFNAKLLLVAATVAILVSVSLYYYHSGHSTTLQYAHQFKKLNIPLYEKDNLGFVEKNKPVQLWVPVLILPQDNETSYYLYDDTLKLKLNLPGNREPKLSIIKKSNLYILQIDSTQYLIKQGIIRFQELEAIKN